MKFATMFPGVLLCASQTFALPTEDGLRSLKASLKKRASPGFNAADQHVSTTGAHAWMPPGSGDLRGPCPGLNALANHGYLPHSGVATPLQFDTAIETVPRIGVIFFQVLAFYGLVTAGDGVSWSIGGPQSETLPLVTPLGLSGTHNIYESDASATRGDLYTHGNNYLMQMDYFKQLYFGPDGNPRNVDLQILSDHRAARFQDSIDNNPYFFAGPVASQLVSSAAHHFIFRLMGNKSEEYPEGQTTPEVFKSWFAVTGDDDNLVYTPGHERIPDNFYTRAADDPYEVNDFAVDLAYFIADHPLTGSVGGNTGKTDTFTGVDIANLTGGVFNAATLAEGNNAACFGMQVLLAGAPSALKGILKPAISLLGCPQLSGYNTATFEQFPGYSSTGGNQ